MAIEIKTGTRSLATHYQMQSKSKNTSPANGEKFDAVLSEKLQATENVNEVSTPYPVENTDKVVFTNVIQEMRKRLDASSEQPIDLEKIARIRQAIEDGTYVINADRIAEKMLNYAY